MQDEAIQNRQQKKKSLSIRAKLTLWNLCAISLLLGTIAIGFYNVVTKRGQKEIDRILQLKSEYLKVVMLRDGTGGAQNSLWKETESLLKAKIWEETLVQIMDESGKILYRSSSLQDQILETIPYQPREIMRTVHLKSYAYPFRLLTLWVPYTRQKYYNIQIGEPLKELTQLQKDIVLGSMIGIPLILIIGTMVGLFLIRQTLKPVEDLSHQAQKITSENLSESLPLISTQDEIGQLSYTLNELIVRLRKSIQKVHQFTADASHELRTPLTILQGEIELALKSMNIRVCQGDSEECKKVFQSSLEEVNRLSRIVHNLLTLSRFDSEQNKIEFHPVCIDDILNKVEEPARLLAIQKKQKFVFQKNDKAVVMADASYLYEVFLNLIDNAIKYTPEGGKITLASVLQNNEVIITLSDTGIGIPEDQTERIFDRFFRVDQERSRPLGGTGLGLAISKKIVASHKGTIQVKSKVGKGTTFIITFPALTTLSSLS